MADIMPNGSRQSPTTWTSGTAPPTSFNSSRSGLDAASITVCGPTSCMRSARSLSIQSFFRASRYLKNTTMAAAISASFLSGLSLPPVARTRASGFVFFLIEGHPVSPQGGDPGCLHPGGPAADYQDTLRLRRRNQLVLPLLADGG